MKNKIIRRIGIIFTSALLVLASSCNRADDDNSTTGEPSIGPNTEYQPTLPSGLVQEITEYTEYSYKSEEEDKDNMLSNGSFSDYKETYVGSGSSAIGAWTVYDMAAGKANFEINQSTGVLETTINTYGTTEYSTQVNQKGVSVVEGSKYSVSFDIKAQKPQNAQCLVQQDYGTYQAYFQHNMVLSTTWLHVEGSFTAPKNDKSASFVFNLGYFPGDNLDSNVIYIDNVKLICTFYSGLDGEKPRDVLVNQLGYYPQAEKIAVFRNADLDSEFTIKDSMDKVVFTGTISEGKLNASSEETCAIADFTEFTTPGKYTICSANSGDSYAFKIDNKAYDGLLSVSINFIYLQRCGQTIAHGIAGHDACHTGKATIYGTSQKIDVTGGWHDAGDYGRYVVSGAKTVQDLLLAYELYGDIYSYTIFNISEKDNDIPDILDEAIYELDWMLKMQASNGEVYHKVSTKEFPGMDVKAHQDDGEEFVSPASYAATADFAAVMASASRVIKSFDSAKADAYKAAAIKAYNALAGMTKKSFKNPEGIVTGEYDDSDLDDEYLWASIELYRLTKEEVYLNNYSAAANKLQGAEFGWQNMSGYALYSACKAINDATNTTYTEALQALIAYADKYKNNIEGDAYGSCLGELYIWGSNMVVCNSGELFILLADLNEEQYMKYLQGDLDYLLGRNATNYSFVTGNGKLSPENPHHRPSIAAGKAVPGMLVGGPNNDFANNGGDGIATAKLEGKVSAAKAYIDHNNSWSTNETTIYWNSPFILLVAGVISMYK